MRTAQMALAIATTAGFLVVILLAIRRTFGRRATLVIACVAGVVVVAVAVLLMLQKTS